MENKIKEIEYVVNLQVTGILKREDDPEFDLHIPQSPAELEMFKNKKSSDIVNLLLTNPDVYDVLVLDTKYFEKPDKV